jgi:hypothetical protein
MCIMTNYAFERRFGRSGRSGRALVSALAVAALVGRGGAVAAARPGPLVSDIVVFDGMSSSTALLDWRIRLLRGVVNRTVIVYDAATTRSPAPTAAALGLRGGVGPITLVPVAVSSGITALFALRTAASAYVMTSPDLSPDDAILHSDSTDVPAPGAVAGWLTMPSPPSPARLRLGEFVGGFGCTTTRGVASVIVSTVGAIRIAHAEMAPATPAGVLGALRAETGLPIVFGGVGDGSVDAGWACRAFPPAPCSTGASFHGAGPGNCAAHAVASGVVAAAGPTFRGASAAPPLSGAVPQCWWPPPSSGSTAASVTYPLRGTVINLPSRANRWAVFNENWAHMATVTAEPFTATPHFRVTGKPHPADGRIASHISAIRNAFETDSSALVVLVLQDNAIPLPDWDARFPDVWQWAVAHAEEFDVVSLNSPDAMPLEMNTSHPSSPIFDEEVWAHRATMDRSHISPWTPSTAAIYSRRALVALMVAWDRLGDGPPVPSESNEVHTAFMIKLATVTAILVHQPSESGVHTSALVHANTPGSIVRPLCRSLYQAVVVREREQVFREVHGFLIAGLRELGFNTSYVSPAECYSPNVRLLDPPPMCERDDVLAWTTTVCINAPTSPIPRHPVWVNLEVLEPDVSLWTRECLAPAWAPTVWTLAPVWDYSHNNLEYLRRTGLAPSAQYLRLRYFPGIIELPDQRYSDRPEPPVDVVFIGSVQHSPRRAAVINALRAAGVSVDVLTNEFNVTREERVRAAKIALNIHFYTRNFETVRLFWLLSLGAFVITEADASVTPEAMEEYAGSVVFAPYDGLVAAVLEWLPRRADRMAIADEGYDWVRATTPGQVMAPMLREVFRGKGVDCEIPDLLSGAH